MIRPADESIFIFDEMKIAEPIDVETLEGEPLMNRYVFRDEAYGNIIASIVILGISGFMVYNLIATKNYLNIIAIILPLLFFIPLYRRRVVIEGENLQFKKTKVSILDVSEILSDKVFGAAAGGRKVTVHIFLMDKKENVLVHFDKVYIKGKKEKKFLDAIKKVNPNVRIDI